MSIRILHTADNHLGLTFKQYPDEVRKRLIKERSDALKNLVDIANDRKAHFIVIAGDLFDKVNVPKPLIDEAVNILKRFEGEAVLVLAGNHDHYEGPDSALWQRFQKAVEGTCVQALLQPRTEQFKIDGIEVIFHPCPCPSKYGTEPVIGWVKDGDKKAGAIHIGIAHGNVEGLGLDTDQRYFNMTESALKDTGMHTWLLGHIHVASPAVGISGRHTFYMSGIHTPDSVRSTRPGHAWFLEINADGSIQHTSVHPGKFNFKRIEKELRHANDIEALRHECLRLD
nr:DNA repair exonuclease [Bacteroidota bacterium]